MCGFKANALGRVQAMRTACPNSVSAMAVENTAAAVETLMATAFQTVLIASQTIRTATEP
jgi:hypothetical protein